MLKGFLFLALISAAPSPAPAQTDPCTSAYNTCQKEALASLTKSFNGCAGYNPCERAAKRVWDADRAKCNKNLVICKAAP